MQRQLASARDNMVQKPGKLSDFGVQLREKQKFAIYGVLERQFRKIFRRSQRRKGSTGEKFIKIIRITVR